jgi:hypothetical protein
MTLDLDIFMHKMTSVNFTAKCEEEKAAEDLAKIEHEKREQEFNQAAGNEKQSLAEYDAARAQRVETEREIVEQASINKEKVQERKETIEYLRSLRENLAKEDEKYKEMRKQQTKRVMEIDNRVNRSETASSSSRPGK